MLTAMLKDTFRFKLKCSYSLAFMRHPVQARSARGTPAEPASSTHQARPKSGARCHPWPPIERFSKRAGRQYSHTTTPMPRVGSLSQANATLSSLESFGPSHIRMKYIRTLYVNLVREKRFNVQWRKISKCACENACVLNKSTSEKSRSRNSLQLPYLPFSTNKICLLRKSAQFGCP